MLIIDFRTAGYIFGGIIIGVIAGVGGAASSPVFWVIAGVLCLGTAFSHRKHTRR